jgi:uncharacterized protein YutE (UPF0331/DUF86 family)
MHQPREESSDARQPQRVSITPAVERDTAMPMVAIGGRPYHRDLLERAYRLKDDGDFELAVVAAQIACELLTERVFSVVLAAEALESLEDPLSKLVRGFNLADDRVRDLYVGLSGDRVQDQTFWREYKEHVKRRNKVVHSGKRVDVDGASKSVQAAADLVDHLEMALARTPGGT